MIRLLANENIPLKSILFLRKIGFDVFSISEKFPGITDNEVLEIAQKEQRTILTFDRDYGELINNYGIYPSKGVIYLRIKDFSPEDPGKITAELFANKDFNPDLKLTVIDSNKIRQRRFIE